AGRLAGLLRDYEYHRQDELIRRWQTGADGYPDAAPRELALERSQRELFERITDERWGLREVLGRSENKRFRSLAEYAAEVMSLPAKELRKPESRPIHVFGLTQISGLHVRILRWLASHYDLHVYHLNPLAGLLGELRANDQAVVALRQVADRFRAASEPRQNHELLGCWGQAAAESLWLMADLLTADAFQVELVSARQRTKTACVLHHLHDALTGAHALEAPRPADGSVQIIACPGIERAVETVYQSILHNLHLDRSLRLTDIVVLVTDMPRYRPVIQTVFDRELVADGEPRRLPYNLADYSAAELSIYGHAALSLLDLALDSFWRSRVFAVLLNPCFLARLGVDREQAVVWLDWAEQLGIYHGWDRQDKHERGYPDSPLYCWRWGLQRLRLGRLMDVADERLDGPVPRFGHVLPFADLASGDKEQLDAFGRAVEALLPRLASLRRQARSGREWAWQLRLLFDDFLAIPNDRPKEEEVRSTLYQALEGLNCLDTLRPSTKAGVPLALVREFVQENLESCQAKAGEFLTGGVTVSALQPLLPVPFRIGYILGLEEGVFPGSSAIPALDLRSRERCPGDIRPAESNRGLFVHALLAARQKLYLLYNSRDLQRDQVLNPCSPLNQLRRFVQKQLVDGDAWPITQVPLSGSDPALLQTPSTVSDACASYSEMERLLAAFEGQQTGTVQLSPTQQEELRRRWQAACPDWMAQAPVVAAVRKTPTVTLAELARFLRCPAEAALRRHLRLRVDDESEPADQEPFYTAFPNNYRLVQTMLERFIGWALTGSVEEALGQWRPRLAALHEEWRLRGRVPEDAFALADVARFEDILRDRLEGQRGLAAYLRERPGRTFCGPVLLGTNSAPVGARRRFPALCLPLPGSSVPEARVVGNLPYVWYGAEAVDVLVLSRKHRSKDSHKQLSSPLLEPLLCLLALRAGSEGAAGEWLGECAWNIHLLDDQGVIPFTWDAAAISPALARAYLEELTTDFLDRACFDLLPFELLGEACLRGAYLEPDEPDFLHWFEEAPARLRARLKEEPAAGLEAADERDEKFLTEIRCRYREAFQDAVDADAEKPHPSYRPLPVSSLLKLEVPVDALDKIRRRFWLLDRGPARARREGR
ncbi:MAG TPA: exodeoxyribonuclease V subunit gamma, partial [Gemmataceae bacterium]|nr:exodeoxyribonuclease V subunit gamma [Gemmataceae bacterium]